MSLALLFAGQGTQHAAMLPWLEACPAAAPGLQRVVALFGPAWRQRMAQPDWAQRNDVAQPLLTGLGLAAWGGLAPLLPVPAVVAGYSVGELAAFCVAGVFSADDALALAADRAAAMDRSVAGHSTGLLSVQGLDEADQQAACGRYGLAVAIRLAADRAVLGGETAALDAAALALGARGLRCQRLLVPLASHTPWMSAAAAAFEARLASVNFRRPQAVLMSNYSGAPERAPDRLKQLLAGQLASTVQWDRCMDAIAERRVRCVLEVGAGHALTNLWRDRHPDIQVRSADEFRSAQAIGRWVNAALH